MKLVFDTESDGFVPEATCVHCIVTIELPDKHLRTHRSDWTGSIDCGVEMLTQATELIGHNIISHDIPLVHKLYPGVRFNPDLKVFDTMILSQLLNQARAGGHSIENFGKIFNRYKPVQEDWSVFTEEMLHRCKEDTEINLMAYEYLKKEAWEDVKGIPYKEIFTGE